MLEYNWKENGNDTALSTQSISDELFGSPVPSSSPSTITTLSPVPTNCNSFNNIRRILESYIQVLKYYEEYNILTKKYRRDAVQCVVSYYMTRKYILKSPEFNRISRNISDTLKCENPVDYYNKEKEKSRLVCLMTGTPTNAKLPNI